MRSTSMTTPMLTLHHDALNEIALRLPAVGSTKPWRDVNSLALTCVRLRQWKKTVVDNYVEIEWNRVSAEVAQTSGWRDSLEKILSDFEHPSRRWFREPVLRKITEAEKVPTTAKPITSVYDFHANLYTNRETASIDEISWFLTLCFDKKIGINKKIELVTKLPSFLTELKSIDRQNALRTMLRLLDNDKKLGLSLKNNGIFKKFEASLDDDEPSEALLELGLRSRGLLTSKTNLKFLGFNLECIPPAERWDWVVKNVPECLNTTVGMQAMLNDSVCRPQMIKHLDESFSECLDERHRLAFCEKISPVYSNLCECRDGEILAKKIVRMVLKGPISKNKEDRTLNTRYMNFLIKHINLVKIYYGKQEKEHLKNAIFKSIKWLIGCQESGQLASIFIALAKNDTKLFKNLHFSGLAIVTWRNVLKHAGSIASLDIRYTYISTLYKAKAKRHYPTVDPVFEEIYSIQLEAIKCGYKVQATT